MDRVAIHSWTELQDREPAHALVGGVDLVLVRHDDRVTLLYGRCAHRGALMADGRVEEDNLICGLHDWDYRLDTGISEYNNSKSLPKFKSWFEGGRVWVDADEIAAWAKQHPQPYQRDAYQGAYQDPTGTADEPQVKFIRTLARDGLTRFGHHGPAAAMGVSRDALPKWDDLQFVVAQLHRLPLLDEDAVGTEIVIGPRASKSLRLDITLFVSDMSFGALSERAKVALARGAERARTGICSGEGACCPTSRPPTRGTSTNSPRPGSGFPGTRCRKPRRSTSRAAKAPKPAPAAICPAPRSRTKSLRSVA